MDSTSDFFVRTLATCGALVALACDSQPQPQPERPVAQVAATKRAQPAEPGCRDYSDLDVATLPPLPKTPYTATLSQVWELVLTKHFDPTLACLDWPAIRLEYGAKLETAEGPQEAYKLMNEMLGRLGQSHFWISSHDTAGPAPTGPARVPIALRWIEDTVTVVDHAVDGHTTKVPRGAQVLSVGDNQVSDRVAAARERAKGPVTFVHALDRELAGMLWCTKGQAVDVVYRAHQSDKSETVSVTCELPKVEHLSVGNLTDIPTRMSSRMLEDPSQGKIGYLAFNFWMLPMVADVEKRLGELRAAGMQALIVDLRGNPGGVGAMSVPIARMMLPEGGSLGTLKFRDFEQTFNVAKNPQAFAGPIAILVDEGTASTSEIFAAGMRDLGRVKIVGGAPSAGAALPSLIQQLDGGAMLQYVVGDYHSSKGAAAEGDGVTLDLRVTETRAAFAEGQDPVLEAATTHLASVLGQPAAG